MRKRHEFEALEEYVIYLSEILMSQAEQLASIQDAQTRSEADITVILTGLTSVAGLVTGLQGQITSLKQQLADAQANGPVDLTAAAATAGDIETKLQQVGATLASLAPSVPADPGTGAASSDPAASAGAAAPADPSGPAGSDQGGA